MKVFGIAQNGADGSNLSRENAFVISFVLDRQPSLNGFWTLTIYNSTISAMVSNVLNGYSINSWTEELVYGPDKTLSIYMQRQAPTASNSKGLPGPESEH
jgi:hypothetical protein